MSLLAARRPRRAAVAALPALIAVATWVGPVGPAGAAAGGAAAFTVSGGPSGPVSLPPGNPTVLTYTVTDTGSAGEEITVRITGLYFEGDTAQFAGNPSPGLHATATPATLDLAPGYGQDVKVTLTAAPGTAPGGLYAGVLFSNVPPSQTGRVNVVTAQGRPLIGHVPGPVTDTGRIASFGQVPGAGPALTLQTSFVDTGDVDYEVAGALTVMGPTGAVGTVAVPSRLMLPGNTRTFPITFTPPAGTGWPAGSLTAHLHLVWGVSAEHSGDVQAPVTIASSPAPPGATPSPGQASLPPTFVGRPLSRVPRHATATGTHTSAWTWALRVVDLLLLLLALALFLIALWSRRRDDDDADQVQPPHRRLATSD
jgi:hypothetical protein